MVKTDGKPTIAWAPELAIDNAKPGGGPVKTPRPVRK